jgi:hypothetical protein
MKRLLVAGALAGVMVVASLAVAMPTNALAPVHPGDYMESSIGACTLGFAFDGTGSKAGNVYFATAAHCVDHVGEDIRLLDGTIVGDVAAVGNAGAPATDWALVQVRGPYEGHVRGAVRGHPTFPTGYTNPSETAQFDLVRFSGYGIGYDLLPLTRESRVGLMGSDSGEEYDLIGLDTAGDSGGPIMHDKTGKALGLVSRGCVVSFLPIPAPLICSDGVSTSLGPTVQGVMFKAAGQGLTVSLRKA